MTILTKEDVKHIVVASLIVGAIFSLTACFEEDTPAQKVENATEDVSQGAEEAVEELDPNRSTGEKIGDAVEETGADIEEAAE